MYFNFFEWTASYTWFRYLLVVVFALYGVYRCYRQITGKDYYFLKNLEDKADMADMADMIDKNKKMWEIIKVKIEKDGNFVKKNFKNTEIEVLKVGRRREKQDEEVNMKELKALEEGFKREDI